MSAAKKSQALITIHAFSRISDNFIHLVSRRRAIPTPTVSVYPCSSRLRWNLPGWLALFKRALSTTTSLSNSGAWDLAKANLVVLHQACNGWHKLLVDCSALCINPVSHIGHLGPVGHISLLVHELLEYVLFQSLLFALLEGVCVLAALDVDMCIATVAVACHRRAGHDCGYLVCAQLKLASVVECCCAHRLCHVVAQSGAALRHGFSWSNRSPRGTLRSKARGNGHALPEVIHRVFGSSGPPESSIVAQALVVSSHALLQVVTLHRLFLDGWVLPEAVWRGVFII